MFQAAVRIRTARLKARPKRQEGRPDLRLPDVHLLPSEEAHEVSRDCWCCPVITQDMKTGRQTISHNSKAEAN